MCLPVILVAAEGHCTEKHGPLTTDKWCKGPICNDCHWLCVFRSQFTQLYKWLPPQNHLGQVIPFEIWCFQSTGLQIQVSSEEKINPIPQVLPKNEKNSKMLCKNIRGSKYSSFFFYKKWEEGEMIMHPTFLTSLSCSLEMLTKFFASNSCTLEMTMLPGKEPAACGGPSPNDGAGAKVTLLRLQISHGGGWEDHMSTKQQPSTGQGSMSWLDVVTPQSSGMHIPQTTRNVFPSKPQISSRQMLQSFWVQRNTIFCLP